MWHRKTEQLKSKGNSSVSKPITIRAGLSVGKQNTSASAARRSRDPPQAMNLSAFLRSISAGFKEDLHADGVEECEESSEARGDHCDVASGASGSDDDNLHDLMATLEDVNEVCSMLERCAHVSSEDDSEKRKSSSHRRKARKMETVTLYGYHDDDDDADYYESGNETGPTTDCRDGSGMWTESPLTASTTSPPLTTSGVDRKVMPSLILQTGSLRLCPRIRKTVTAAKTKAKTLASEDESSTSPSLSATATRQRRREAQRLLLRRSLSGRFTRKAGTTDVLSHLALLPHTRIAKTTCRHSKRSRSATKKELPETPRSHTEEVVIRKAIGHANRRYLIPRLPRLQHFNLHVVLDLDETLVSARNGPILVRPYVGHLMKMLMDLRCEVILWTAGIPQYVAGIIAGLTMAIQGLSSDVCEQVRPPWLHHLIQRNERWYDEESVCVKNLKLLGRPLERVLIIENNPAAVQMQISNAVLVQDYSEENYNDKSLEVISRVVSRCARSIEPVFTSLANDPDLLFVEFDLAAEHSISNKPIRPVEYGLRYTPPNTRQREYAGESPCSVAEKEEGM